MEWKDTGARFGLTNAVTGGGPTVAVVGVRMPIGFSSVERIAVPESLAARIAHRVPDAGR